MSPASAETLPPEVLVSASRTGRVSPEARAAGEYGVPAETAVGTHAPR